MSTPARSSPAWPVVLFLLVSLAACQRKSAGETYDHVGTAIRPGPAQRVVALAPDVTEIVFALFAADKLVAVAETADFPPPVRHLPRCNPASIEAILAYRPDLVLATTAGNDPRVVRRLGETGLRTVTVDPTSLARVADGFRLIGEVLGEGTRGRQLADSFLKAVAAARAHAATLPSCTGVYVVWSQPLLAAAPGTFHHDLLAAARVTNLAPAGGGRYPPLNPEILLDRRLDLLIAPDDPDIRAGLRHLSEQPAGRRLRSGDLPVLWLAADPASRPGPRLLEALEQLVDLRMALEQKKRGQP